MQKTIEHAKKGLFLLVAIPIVAVALFLNTGGGDAVLSVRAADGDPIYMKIEGIEGETTDLGHEKEIDVQSWSWGMSQASTGRTGGGAGTGKVSVHDLSVTKHVDASSPELMLACASGKYFPKIELTMRKSSEAPEDYLRYAFFDVFCDEYKVGGSASEPVPTESISFNFTKVLVEYTEQKPDGSKGTPEQAGWNFEKNKPS